MSSLFEYLPSNIFIIDSMLYLGVRMLIFHNKSIIQMVSHHLSRAHTILINKILQINKTARLYLRDQVKKSMIFIKASNRSSKSSTIKMGEDYINDIKLILSRLYDILNENGHFLIINFDKNQKIVSNMVFKYKQWEEVQCPNREFIQ